VDLVEILYGGDGNEGDADHSKVADIETNAVDAAFEQIRWMWMKFRIVVMVLKVTSIIPKWLSFLPPLITFGRFTSNLVVLKLLKFNVVR
jgi:hypothetical protein